MTAIKQDFTMYAGDSKEIIVAVVKEDNTPLELTDVNVIWAMQSKKATVKKDTSNGITVEGASIHIKLEPEDTELLSGAFNHQGKIVDVLENVSTVFTGTVLVMKSLV